MRALLFFLTAVLSTGAAAQLLIEDGYALAPAPVQANAVAYMRLTNGGDETLVLESARTDSATRAAFHRHTHADGRMRMEPVARIELQPGQSLQLEPGGYHLMLMQVAKPLVIGSTVSITLIAEDGREFNASFPVRDARHLHH